MNNKSSWGLKIIASIFSLLIFVTICESTVRILNIETFYKNGFFVINRDLDFPDVTLKDRDLLWKLRPNRTITSKFFDGNTIQTNSLGLRGKEVGNKSDCRRIVALGNSCTFGWGVDENRIFTNQLESMLGRDYEVINAGTPGYSSYQGKVFIEKEMDHLKPDILLVLFAWNDHWPAADGIQDKDQQFPPKFVLDVQNQLSRLHSYRLLRKWLLSIFEKEERPRVNPADLKFRVGLEDFYSNLKEICYRAKLDGATPILMTSPIPPVEKQNTSAVQSTINIYHAEYNNVIRQLAIREKIAIVDLAEEFEKHNDLFDKPTYDSIHFNNKGHRLAAETIAKLINSLID